MAKKTDKKEKAVEEKKMSGLIIKPRITEKASSALERANAYTFDVLGNANKNQIAKEIFATYKVKPVRVNILAVPGRITALRGRESKMGKTKKAVVFLKKGDKIDF